MKAFQAKGFPDRDNIGLSLNKENIAGVSVLKLTFQNTPSAPISLSTSCKMSFCPTETPPVVITKSASSIISHILSPAFSPLSPIISEVIGI